MKISRRSLLTAAGASLAIPGRAFAAADRKLLVITAAGGWDVTYTFDPKLGNPGIDGPEVDATGEPDDVEAVTTFGELPILTNGHRRPHTTTFFERWGQRTAVVNGVWVGAIAHLPCRVRVLTGTARHTNPDVSVITGHTFGQGRPLGSVDLSGRAYSGSLAASQGRFGMRGQVRTLTDRSTAFDQAPGGPPSPGFILDPAGAARVEDHIRARAMDVGATMGPVADVAVSDLLESIERARRLVDEGTVPIGQLPVGREPDFETQGQVAIGLLAGGIASAVMIDTGSQWDTHYSTVDQHDNYDTLFRSLDTILGQMDSEGLLDDTLVCVLSEMTRTPLRNADGGKDHWPHTSALFIGGGVTGGRVLGATDDSLISRPMDLRTGQPTDAGDLLKYDNLAAGILQHMGVDPEAWLPGVVPFTAL